MKYFVFFFLFSSTIMCNSPQIDQLTMGLSREEGHWSLVVWSASAEEMRVVIYEENDSKGPIDKISMSVHSEGLWKVELDNSFGGKYYTVQTHAKGAWSLEVVEPYAKLVGVNGMRGYIGDPQAGDPTGWSSDAYVSIAPRDAIIYELQIRDFSIDEEADFKNPGKYLAFTEVGLSLNGQSIGLDHLKEIGITHVHLLPAFDFRSIDETEIDSANYNWGYEPLNYNVPEGSFSSNPHHPLVRVEEFKEMVLALHKAGIGVIMDVVYNHTGPTVESSFNQIDPGYYYRMNGDEFSNASACGNETASEQPMMRKFIIESMSYWMQEYHVDGFRVDLMGIHDIETMNLVSQRLKAINPNVLLYGEGWTAGSSPLKEDRRAIKQNTSELDDIAVFSDEFRDALKGHWNTPADRGFVTGKPGQKESLKFGLVGAVNHSEIDYSAVNYSEKAWSDSPMQMVSYVSCHDGMTLIDKISRSYPGLNEDQYTAKQKLANTFVLLSQGIPLLHAGADFMRTKHFVENSFESPDSINAIDWTLKENNLEVFKYYQRLIQLRKDHPVFSKTSQIEVEESIRFIEHEDELLLICSLDATGTEDEWRKVLLIFNGDLKSKTLVLPEGLWEYALFSGDFNVPDDSLVSHEMEIGPSSASILFQQVK